MLVILPPDPPTEKQLSAEFQPKHVQLERHHFSSQRHGPHFVGTARIHGDEPSGELAFRRLIKELNDPDNPLRLKRGDITLFPVINQPAAFSGVRGLTRDPNRHIKRLKWWHEAKDPERLIGDALAREFFSIQWNAFRHYQPWYHGDFHDVPTPGSLHTVIADRPNDLSVAKAIGAPVILTDWRQAQIDISDDELAAIGRTRKEQKDFTTAAIYAARNYRAAGAVCVEGGYNGDEKSKEAAYEALRNYLAHLDILPPLDEDERKHTLASTFTRISIQKAIYKQDESEELVIANPHDNQPLKPGELVLAGDKRQIHVPDPLDDQGEWRLIHPIPKPKVGDHVAYLAWRSELGI